MGRTHGNCAQWTQESQTHVFCAPDLLPGCWYSRHGNASKCKYWKPRIIELHLKFTKLEVEQYDDKGESQPLSVIAHCNNGKKYQVQPSHVLQVRSAGWTAEFYHYTENEVRYRRTTWRGPALGIVVIGDSQVGN